MLKVSDRSTNFRFREVFGKLNFLSLDDVKTKTYRDKKGYVPVVSNDERGLELKDPAYLRGHHRLHNILSIADHSGYPDDGTKFLCGDRTWAVPSCGSGTKGQVTIWDENNILTGYDDLFREPVTGNFGIGTNNPFAQLHIGGVLYTTPEKGIQSVIDRIPEDNEDPYIIALTPGVYDPGRDIQLNGRYVGFVGLGGVTILHANIDDVVNQDFRLFMVKNIKWVDSDNCGTKITAYLRANSYPRIFIIEDVYINETRAGIGTGGVSVIQVDEDPDKETFVFASNLHFTYPHDEQELTENHAFWITTYGSKVNAFISDVYFKTKRQPIRLLSDPPADKVYLTLHNATLENTLSTGCIDGSGNAEDIIVNLGAIKFNEPLSSGNLTINYLSTSPKQIQSQSFIYGVTTGSSNAYILTPDPAITAYVEGQRFCIKANHTNTGASTIAISGLVAKSIKKNITKDLEAGEITENQVYYVVYDGTNFQLLSSKIGAGGGMEIHDNTYHDPDFATELALTTHTGNQSNPHIVTKTQVGLSNVTDDAQLKRTGGDFNFFDEKANPVADDTLLIEDSEDESLAKKRIKLSSLPSGSGHLHFWEEKADWGGGDNKWFLTNAPIDELHITGIFKNGLVLRLETDYTYDPEENKILFDTAPNEGDITIISYAYVP